MPKNTGRPPAAQARPVRKTAKAATVHISDQGEDFNFEGLSDTSDREGGQGLNI
jgi:hypothetical protein